MEIIPEILLLCVWAFVVFGFIYTGSQALRQRAVWIPYRDGGGRVVHGKAARVIGRISLIFGLSLLALSVWFFFRIAAQQ